MPAKKPTKVSAETYQRLAAEYANFQRRTEEEKQLLAEHVRAEVLEKLFPIMDNLERASAHAPTINDTDFIPLTDQAQKITNYINGLKQIEKQLEDTLATLGLERIVTAGQPFNHLLHEAISHEDSKAVTADHIIAEVESGWQLNGKVIRPAKVRVSKG